MFKSNIFIKSMSIILVLIIGYVIAILIFATPKIESSIYSLEKKNSKILLHEIVSISNTVHTDIGHFQKVALDIHKKSLQNINSLAYSILQNSYLKYKNGELSEAEAKKSAYKKISQLRYGENGYFFIIDDNYYVLVHADEKNIGKNRIDLQDIKGKYFIREMIDNARNNKEGFVKYWWPKIIGDPFQKLSYIKKFEPWNVYLGTGIYIDIISKKIEVRKKELFNNLRQIIINTKIGKTGYIYVVNSKGEMVYHPDRTLEGTNVKNIKNPTKNSFLFEDLVKAFKTGKELSYKWNKPDDKEHYIYEKRSWIEYIPELEWYIISAAYVDELEQSSYELKESLFFIGLGLLLLSVFIASLFFRKLDYEIGKKTHEVEALKERMELALLGNNDGVWDWNISDNSVYFSPRWKEMLGYSNDELSNLYSTWEDRVHRDDLKDANADMQSNIDGNTPYYENIHRLRHKDGHWVWILSRAKTQYDEKGKATRMIGTHTDISDEKTMQHKFAQQSQIIDQIHDGVISTDLKGNIVNWNSGAEKIFGYSANEVMGKHISILYRQEDILALKEYIVALMKTGMYNADLYLLKQSKDIISISLSLTLLRDESGDPIGMIGIYQDITQRKKAEDALREQKLILDHQAHHDALTGLPNRVLLNDRLEHGIEKSKRNNSKLALFFIDLDHFKEINDSLGHTVGDKVLTAVTQRLAESIRKEDTLARLGGDEFTIVMEDLTHVEDVSQLAQKILEILTEPVIIEKNVLYVSCSIGVSLYPDDGDNANDLLKFADVAMYKAKDEGRNNFQFYSSEMTRLVLERVEMEASLREALKNEEFVIYYQPQVNAKTDTLIGMEGLIRWKHPTMGLILPDKFIPLLQKTGLIIQLDQWVMKTAVMQMVQWYSQGFNPGVLALNLTIKQLEEKDFIATLETMLKEIKCKPEWIELEITEGQIMNNPEKAILILNQISDMGISLAVDDFGTGYSSLSYLKRLPIDRLKIDRSFVRALLDDDEDAGIVKSVIALSKSLNLKVIAEGVETKEQKDFLVENGCYDIQGHFYARPVSVEEMEDILSRGFEFS